MRIFTVTCRGRPMAVVRASDRSDAIDVALDLAAKDPAPGYDAREPNDAEMVLWLERREDFLLEREEAVVP